MFKKIRKAIKRYFNPFPNVDKVFLLKQLRSRIIIDSPFMCYNLILMVNEGLLTRDQRKWLIEELWADRVTSALSHDLMSEGYYTSKEPFSGRWYEYEDLRSRYRNIDRTIYRLEGYSESERIQMEIGEDMDKIWLDQKK